MYVPIAGTIRAEDPERIVWHISQVRRDYRPPARVVRYPSDWEPSGNTFTQLEDHISRGGSTRSSIYDDRGYDDYAHGFDDGHCYDHGHHDHSYDHGHLRGQDQLKTSFELGRSPGRDDEHRRHSSSVERNKSVKPSVRSSAARADTRFKPSIDPSLPRELGQFLAAFDCGDKDDPAHKSRRAELYSSFDGNGNGWISLSETGGGILQTLSNLYKANEATELYKRFYRSYIRAFVDARDASPSVGVSDDHYVSRSEFRLLIVYLRVYATWHEVFRLVDCERSLGMAESIVSLDIEVPQGDHRISRDEWVAALPKIQDAANCWAPYLALQEATADDFDAIDVNNGGMIDLQEFCGEGAVPNSKPHTPSGSRDSTRHVGRQLAADGVARSNLSYLLEWIEKAEKAAGTPIGLELGVNEPLDKSVPQNKIPRRWHTAPLEVMPRNKSSKIPPIEGAVYGAVPSKATPPKPTRAEMAARAEAALLFGISGGRAARAAAVRGSEIAAARGQTPLVPAQPLSAPPAVSAPAAAPPPAASQPTSRGEREPSNVQRHLESQAQPLQQQPPPPRQQPPQQQQPAQQQLTQQQPAQLHSQRAVAQPSLGIAELEADNARLRAVLVELKSAERAMLQEHVRLEADELEGAVEAMVGADVMAAIEPEEPEPWFAPELEAVRVPPPGQAVGAVPTEGTNDYLRKELARQEAQNATLHAELSSRGGAAESSPRDPMAVAAQVPWNVSPMEYPSQRYARDHGRGETIDEFRHFHPEYPYVTKPSSHLALAAYHLAHLSTAAGGHSSLDRPSAPVLRRRGGWRRDW